MKWQNQREVAAEVEGQAQAQLGRAHQCGTLALSHLIQKGFEGSKCELHSKVIEEFNLGK